MRRLVFILIALLAGVPAHSGSIEAFGGAAVSGKVELDYGGIVFRPSAGGAAVKLDFSNLYRVQLDAAVADDFVPGVVLRNGVRLAAPFGPLTEATWDPLESTCRHASLSIL